MICLEKIEDIPRLQELFAQILIVHHQARSDILKVKGSKFTDKELEGVIGDANKPVFVYEDEAGTILCHLFLIIKEVSENDGPQKPIKTLFIDDLCVEEKARGQKLGEKLYQFALWIASLGAFATRDTTSVTSRASSIFCSSERPSKRSIFTNGIMHLLSFDSPIIALIKRRF